MFRCYALMAWMVHKTAAGVGFTVHTSAVPWSCHKSVSNLKRYSEYFGVSFFKVLNTAMDLEISLTFQGPFNININGLILGTKMFFCHFKNRFNFYHSSDKTSKTEDYWHCFTKKNHQRLMTNIIIIFLKSWV